MQFLSFAYFLSIRKFFDSLEILSKPLHDCNGKHLQHRHRNSHLQKKNQLNFTDIYSSRDTAETGNCFQQPFSRVG